jgi:ATPase subunit of ABC transporter with duplicated ATPase domains
MNIYWKPLLWGTRHYIPSKEMDELYLDYNDKNADRIGELQVQFEEMSGWSADSDAAMLSNLGIGEEHHFTLMADLEEN